MIKHRHSEIPHDSEAEKCVLGSVILNSRVALDVAATIVRASDFLDEANRELFQACIELQSKGQAIDTATLAAELKARGTWDGVGGAAYLTQVVRSVPHAHHVKHYAEIVKRYSVRRQMIALGEEIVSLAHDDSRDPESLTGAINSSTIKALESVQRNRSQLISDCAEEIGENIVQGRYSKPRGIQTRFQSFNKITRGLCTGLIVIGARPSTGKSAILLNWAIDEAEKSGRTIGLFSLEMLSHEITERAIAYKSHVPSEKWGSLSEQDRQRVSLGVSKLLGTNVLIEDRPDVSVGEICATVRLWARQHDLAFVAIDYLQLIRPDNPKDSRQLQIGAMSRQLKRLSLELNIPVVVASQLNRDADGERPTLRSLRESGDIEQDADTVHFLWKDEGKAESSPRRSRYSDPPEPSPPSDGPEAIKLTIGKQRNGRRGVDLDLIFHGPEFRFEEPAPPWMDERESESNNAFPGGGDGF